MYRRVVWIVLLLFGVVKVNCESSLASLYPLPSITNEEPETQALEGSDVTLTCQVSCQCPQRKDIKTSWLQNGKKIFSGGRITVKAGDLHINNVTTDSVAGNVFRCIASIGNWSVVGIERKISVINPSSISVFLTPVKQTLSTGDTASLKCIASTPHISTAKVSWYKDDTLLPTANAKKYHILTNGILLIHALSVGDVGSYKCRIFNKFVEKDIESNEARLAIGSNNARIKLPHFTHRLSNQEVTEGHPVSIYCTASASPLPRVSISFKSRNDDATIKEVASGFGYANVTLMNVKMENDGEFICKAGSGVSAITSSASLRVLAAPRFIQVPKERILTLDQVTLSLTCNTDASRRPAPTITWFKDGVSLRNDQSSNFIIDGKLIVRYNSTHPMKKKDVGIYQCFATNKIASIYHSTFVFLERAVRPPIITKAEALSSSTIRVSWRPNPLNNKDTIVAHMISYTDIISTAKDKKKEQVSIKSTDFIIDQLFGGTVYSIYLVAYGENSEKSDQTETVYITTLESVPSIAPEPEAVNFGNRTIHVTWKPIPRKHANGKIVRYKIEYGIAGSLKKIIYVPARETFVDIHDLIVGQLYMIEISAATKVGFGVTEKTTIKIGDPEIAGQKGPALELQTGQSEIIVKWSFGTTNLITGFELSYIRVPSAYYWHDIQKVQLKPEARDYVIKHIDMSKIHRIELRIKSGPVISKPSVAVYIADKRAVILEDWRRLKVSNPQNLNCDVKDNTTIFLSWGRPVKYADIDDYTVHIIHGGKTIEKLKIPHTKELKYLIKNVSRGMWYYARVKANPRRSRVEEIRRQSKKQIAVPDYYSKVVACQTVDDKPEPPSRPRCNVSSNGLEATITWYPPDFPRGLITKYVMKYREKSLRLTSEWTVKEMILRPSSSGFPFGMRLDGDYYKRYEVRIFAVNSAGEGRPAKIDTCAFRRAQSEITPKHLDKEEESVHLMSDDTKLGIIIGCTVASVFILTFIIIFIWKNPFRMKTNEVIRNQNNTVPNGVCKDDFLYLQRLAELQNSLSRDMNDYSSRCTSDSSTRLNNGRITTEGDKDNPPSEPLMSKYPTVVELTGSSSGPAVCTCTCLLHGRLRGQSIIKQNKADYISSPNGTTDDRKGAKSSASSSTSEDVDSAESADSRTKMLPKSDGPTCVIKDAIATTKITLQKKQETTFEV